MHNDYQYDQKHGKNYYKDLLGGKYDLDHEREILKHEMPPWRRNLNAILWLIVLSPLWVVILASFICRLLPLVRWLI